MEDKLSSIKGCLWGRGLKTITYGCDDKILYRIARIVLENSKRTMERKLQLKRESVMNIIISGLNWKKIS